MDDELIRVCALATRVACQRMTPPHLKSLRDSVEQACSLPTRTAWDRKVTAHAEIVNLLADAAPGPVPDLLVCVASRVQASAGTLRIASCMSSVIVTPTE